MALVLWVGACMCTCECKCASVPREGMVYCGKNYCAPVFVVGVHTGRALR